MQQKKSFPNSLLWKSQEMIENREIGGDATRFAILQKLEMKISFPQTKLNKPCQSGSPRLLLSLSEVTERTKSSLPLMTRQLRSN